MLSLTTLLMSAVLTAPTDVHLVKFTADWCAPCKAMEPVLEQVAQQGVRVTRIDIDRQPEVARSYQVIRVPTVFLVVDGKIVDRIDGAVDLSQLTARLRQAGHRVSPKQWRTATPASAIVAARTQPRPAEAERLAMRATVRLRIEDADGHSYGTGTIVHRHGNEALILTCGHIFRDSQGTGRIQIDLFANGSSHRLSGELIRFDLERDLALVGIRTEIPIQPVRVAGSNYNVAIGQRLFSLGCNKGASPTAMRGQLRAVNKYLGPENLVVSGQPSDGRSGGGLFSQDGQLVGVCNAADPDQDEGLYAAFASVHRYLDEAKLAFVYGGSTTSLLASDSAPAMPSQTIAVTPPGSRDLQRSLPVRPASAIHGNVPSSSFSERLASGARGVEPDNAEVICIIRPKNRPHEKSAVVVLERPSKNFISHLQREADRQSHQQSTQMRVGNRPLNPVRAGTRTAP